MEIRTTAGRGIGIAIIDTGIYPHIDFDTRIRVFQDFVNGRKEPYDDNGHGTHVAGIAAGSGVGSGGKYRGTAPKADLFICKVLDRSGNGNLKDVLHAFEWIKENWIKQGIRIVNISVGSAGPDSKNSRDLIKGAEEMWDQGLVVVTAAGNMGPAPCSITAPGSSRKVITVGSCDLLNEYYGISGAGPTRDFVQKPDIVTPGKNIISCAPGQKPSYTVKSGTSMSTPVVSGAIARLLEESPCLSNQQVKDRLKYAAIDMGYPFNRQGWGRLDVEKYVRSRRMETSGGPVF